MPEGILRSPHRYIPTLDGWRAVAITLVIFHHDQLHRLGPLSSSWLYDHGQAGVDIFFAISGLLICTLLLNEERETGKISLSQFYFRRAFRILPASLAYLLALVVLRCMQIITAVHVSDWFGAVFFYRNLLADTPSTWYTGHFWSLSVEEHFYFILPAFLVLCFRNRAQILVGTGVATLIAGVIAGHLGYHVGFSDFRLGALLIAAGAAVILRHEWIRAKANHFIVPFLAVVAMLAVITFSRGSVMALLLPFTALFAVASTVLNPTSPIASILESKPLRFIGKRSYSLYLWQQLFMISHWIPNLDFGLQRWPLSLIFTFGCACLSYELIEQPMIRFGRRIAATRSSAQIARVAS